MNLNSNNYALRLIFWLKLHQDIVPQSRVLPKKKRAPIVRPLIEHYALLQLYWQSGTAKDTDYLPVPRSYSTQTNFKLDCVILYFIKSFSKKL